MAGASEGLHAGAGHAACANCGAALVGPFCHACGQGGHVHRTVGAILHDIGHGVFHFEGKVWRTLPLLVWRPGELTRRYIDGERVRFVSPIALFLFSVFLMFASLNLVAGVVNIGGVTGGAGELDRQIAAEHDAAVAGVARLEERRASAVAAGRGRDEIAQVGRRLADAEREERKLAAARAAVGLPDKVSELGVNTGDKALDTKLGYALDNPELTLYKVKATAYKYSWSLIPISLPFIWLLFPLRRDVGLYDHAVFATYSLAFMTLLVVAAGVASWARAPAPLVWTALALLPPVHMFAQLRGAYSLGRWGALWRTTLLLFFTFFTLTLFGLLLGYLGLA